MSKRFTLPLLALIVLLAATPTVALAAPAHAVVALGARPEAPLLTWPANRPHVYSTVPPSRPLRGGLVGV
jgi:hypothetical protein